MKKHVVIIGGGVVGRCTAYYAARHGHHVTLIDRRTPEFPGCSFGNAGFVSPSHFTPLAAPGMIGMALKWMLDSESPFYVKPNLRRDFLSWALKFYRACNPEHVERASPVLRDLHLNSRTCYEEFAKLGEFGYAQRGCLMLCDTERALEEEKRNALTAMKLGLKTEIVGPADLARLEPGLRLHTIGGVHFLDDAHLIPGEFMALLVRQLEESRVACHWTTNVTGWKTDGRTIDAVRTTAGDIKGDEYVIAGGSWSPLLVRQLGIRLPMQAGKGYSLTLPNPHHPATIPAIFIEARLAVTPMGNTLRFGGTMEITGLDESINPPRVRGILKSVLKHYPDYRNEDFDEVKAWCGLRPLSPDGLPFIGRFKKYSNLSVGTGHAMQGLSQGPITGKLLAEMLSEEAMTMDLTPLSPERYH